MTAFIAVIATSIMESSGSKVVKFWSHNPGAVSSFVTGPSCRPAVELIADPHDDGQHQQVGHKPPQGVVDRPDPKHNGRD